MNSIIICLYQECKIEQISHQVTASQTIKTIYNFKITTKNINILIKELNNYLKIHIYQVPKNHL